MNNKELHIGFLKLGKFTSDFYLTELKRLSNELNIPIRTNELEVNFEEWNQYLPYGFEFLEPRLEEALLRLKFEEIQTLIIPNITLHFTLDRLVLSQELLSKIVHPIKETVAHLKENEVKEVTLVGTKYTMNSKLMDVYFEKEGIKTNKLNEKDIQLIDELRRKVYESGQSPDLEKKFHELVSTYKNPLIICTELSILNTHSDMMDMVKIHLKKAVV